MKKSKFIVLLLVLSFIWNGIEPNKVFAENVPYGLISPINDQEPNNTFETALKINENQDVFDFPHLSGSVSGLISSTTDVDYYTINVFANSSLAFGLTMLDNSMNQMFEYNFEIYIQKNITNPGYSYGNFELIYTSSSWGTNDYYNFVAEAGTYFVKIFSNNSSSNRFSYNLQYSVNPTSRNSYNVQEYANETDDGFALWVSDFIIADYSEIKLYETEKKLYSTTSSPRTSKHNLVNEYLKFNNYPTFEIYFWGEDIRNELVYFLETMINRIEEIQRLAGNYNVSIDFVVEVINDSSNYATVISLLFGELPVVSTICSFYSLRCYFISNLLIPLEIDDADKLLRVYENLLYAVANSSSTADDDVVYCLTFKSMFDSKYSIINLSYNNYIYFDFNNSGSRYVEYYRYNNEYVYDIKQYDHNNDGSYSNIYGKIYIEDAIDAYEMYFGRIL